MNPLVIVPLFVVTAIAELAGCYLVFLWMRGERSALLLAGAAVSLGIFAWLLALRGKAARARELGASLERRGRCLNECTERTQGDHEHDHECAADACCVS
jgi:hypothetical protein